jgi:hypothetical protein
MLRRIAPLFALAALGVAPDARADANQPIIKGDKPPLASGQGPKLWPAWIEKIDDGVCFKAAELVDEVRARLPAVEIHVGAERKSGVGVVVIEGKAELEVLVTRRVEAGAPRSEWRRVPLAAGCRVALETVASIVTRAVVPLGTPVPEPPPIVTPPIVVPLPRPHRLEFRVLIGPITVVGPVDTPPPPPPWLQLGVAFRYAVPLDAGGHGPGLLLTAGVRWNRWLFLVGGGVEAPYDNPFALGTITLRRAPLRAGFAYELDLPRGVLRLGLGVLLELWAATLTQPAGSQDSVVVQAGAYIEAGYHLRIWRAFEVFAAIDLESSFVGQPFTVDGYGTVATTAAWWFLPRLGVAFNFF